MCTFVTVSFRPFTCPPIALFLLFTHSRLAILKKRAVPVYNKCCHKWYPEYATFMLQGKLVFADP